MGTLAVYPNCMMNNVSQEGYNGVSKDMISLQNSNIGEQVSTLNQNFNHGKDLNHYLVNRAFQEIFLNTMGLPTTF